MSKVSQIITIEDKWGFIYEVKVIHEPQHGFSTARYQDELIADVSYGKLTEPHGDNDREWEMHDERLEEWKADAIDDLRPACVEYFNSKQ